MKKFAYILCAVLVFAATFTLLGCAKDEVYRIERLKFEMEGGVIEIGVGEEYNGFVLTEDYFTVLLKADGTSELSGMYASGTGTWKKSGNTVTITIEGEPQTFLLQNGKLIMEEGSVEEGLKYTVILSK